MPNLTALEILEHSGVRGMRWGVLRSRSAKAAAKAEAKSEKESSDTDSPKGTSGKSNASSKSKSVKDMSDDELKTFIARKELEQKFVRLSAPEKSAGRKFTEKVLSDVGTAVAKDIVKSHLTKAVSKAVAKPKPGSAP